MSFSVCRRAVCTPDNPMARVEQEPTCALVSGGETSSPVFAGEGDEGVGSDACSNTSAKEGRGASSAVFAGDADESVDSDACSNASAEEFWDTAFDEEEREQSERLVWKNARAERVARAQALLDVAASCRKEADEVRAALACTGNEVAEIGLRQTGLGAYFVVQTSKESAVKNALETLRGRRGAVHPAFQTPDERALALKQSQIRQRNKQLHTFKGEKEHQAAKAIQMAAE